MPHLLLEYTDNLAAAFNPRQTLFRLHKSLVGCKLCTADELKSRAIKLHDYLVGDGSREQGFVHLRFAQHATCNEDEKRQIVESLHAQLVACIGSPAIPVQITTESVDLEPERIRYLRTVQEPR